MAWVTSHSLLGIVLLILSVVITISQVQGVCQDKISNCKDYDKSSCQTYKDWAEKECAKTCGYCKSTCQDKLPDCKAYGQGVCKNFVQWSKTNCANMCNLCLEKKCDLQCPSGSYRLISCSCECTNGRVYSEERNSCECPKLSCAWYEIEDPSTCKCVAKPCSSRCPVDARQLADCTCRCKNTNKILRNNQCVCPKRNCASYEKLDESSCQCVRKPCTNQCPANSQRQPDCSCRCNQGYNARNNQCVKKSAPCPADWKLYSNDKTCLRVIGFRNTNNRISWHSAKGQCQYYGGSLVIIRDEWKNKFVKEMVPKGEVVWTGLKNVGRDANDFEFKYVDGSYTGDYHPWTIDNPDNYNGQERCVVLERTLWDGYWNDLDCGVKRAYVCQKQAKQS